MNPLQVLLAEDNRGDVFLIREALRVHQIDYSLHVVNDGVEAAHYLKHMGVSGIPCPEIFLLDLNLPKGDGHELLHSLRAHPECAQVPVIIVTSSDAPRDRARAELLGAAAYFRKPSDLGEFMELGAVVNHVLRKSEEARAQSAG